MPDDPFYRSAAWRKLRAQRLAIDNRTCVVPGCGHRAVTVDHIVSRRNGGRNRLSNLRSLCTLHDNQAKEGADGQRRSGGKFKVIGCDADGRPRDPSHPWSR